MKVTIDTDEGTINVIDTQLNSTSTYPLNSPTGFYWASKAWLRCGWDTKHVYTFTWLGRPIIQLPEDLLRLQEVIYQLKPDVIIETGVAHGGGLVFYASLCKNLNKGKVIGIDIEIRPHNRLAIEQHELYEYITLYEGSSTSPEIIKQVKENVETDSTALVVLDSNHSKMHVLNELKAYSELVSIGSYIIATDGIMKDLATAPRSKPDWTWNNPHDAAQEFAAENKNFKIEQPHWLFNESNGLADNITYWPDAWLKRIR